MKQHYFNGKVILDENDTSKMNYIIEDNSTKEQTSITEILDNIFNSTKFNKKLVRILGRVHNHNSIKDLNGMGNLLRCRSNYSCIEGYCIGSLQLDLRLFDLVGFEVEVILEDYTDFVFSGGLVKNENATSIS